MKLNKVFVYCSIFLIAWGIMSCSSQEYTTAKLAIQQSDFTKASCLSGVSTLDEI